LVGREKGDGGNVPEKLSEEFEKGVNFIISKD
jgi:hypothetical protein